MVVYDRWPLTEMTCKRSLNDRQTESAIFQVLDNSPTPPLASSPVGTWTTWTCGWKRVVPQVCIWWVDVFLSIIFWHGLQEVLNLSAWCAEVERPKSKKKWNMSKSWPWDVGAECNHANCIRSDDNTTVVVPYKMDCTPAGLLLTSIFPKCVYYY